MAPTPTMSPPKKVLPPCSHVTASHDAPRCPPCAEGAATAADTAAVGPAEVVPAGPAVGGAGLVDARFGRVRLAGACVGRSPPCSSPGTADSCCLLPLLEVTGAASVGVTLSCSMAVATYAASVLVNASVLCTSSYWRVQVKTYCTKRVSAGAWSPSSTSEARLTAHFLIRRGYGMA